MFIGNKLDYDSMWTFDGRENTNKDELDAYC